VITNVVDKKYHKHIYDYNISVAEKEEKYDCDFDCETILDMVRGLSETNSQLAKNINLNCLSIDVRPNPIVNEKHVCKMNIKPISLGRAFFEVDGQGQHHGADGPKLLFYDSQDSEEENKYKETNLIDYIHPEEEKESMDSEHLWPFGLQLNLISTLLYMANYFVAGPTSVEYVNALGADEALAGKFYLYFPLIYQTNIKSIPFSKVWLLEQLLGRLWSPPSFSLSGPTILLESHLFALQYYSVLEISCMHQP